MAIRGACTVPLWLVCVVPIALPMKPPQRPMKQHCWIAGAVGVVVAGVVVVDVVVVWVVPWESIPAAWFGFALAPRAALRPNVVRHDLVRWPTRTPRATGRRSG